MSKHYSTFDSITDFNDHVMENWWIPNDFIESIKIVPSTYKEDTNAVELHIKSGKRFIHKKVAEVLRCISHSYEEPENGFFKVNKVMYIEVYDPKGKYYCTYNLFQGNESLNTYLIHKLRDARIFGYKFEL